MIKEKIVKAFEDAGFKPPIVVEREHYFEVSTQEMFNVNGSLVPASTAVGYKGNDKEEADLYVQCSVEAIKELISSLDKEVA